MEFYDNFKNGYREETIRLLQQNGDVINSARTRWSVAQRIFKNEWQQKSLECIIKARRIDDEIKVKARELLAKEREKRGV